MKFNYKNDIIIIEVKRNEVLILGRKKESVTIGKLAGSRGSWGSVKPVTKVIQDKTKYTRKSKHKGKGVDYK